jgi:hypothetical protein
MVGNDVQSDAGRQIQEQDADFIDGHTAIVHGVELSLRQAKPTPMEAAHPVMGQGKDYEPQEQDQVVNDRAPQKELTEWEVIHGVSRDSCG